MPLLPLSRDARMRLVWWLSSFPLFLLASYPKRIDTDTSCAASATSVHSSCCIPTNSTVPYKRCMPLQPRVVFHKLGQSALSRSLMGSMPFFFITMDLYVVRNQLYSSVEIFHPTISSSRDLVGLTFFFNLFLCNIQHWVFMVSYASLFITALERNEFFLSEGKKGC